MNIRRIHLGKMLVSYDWRTNAFIPEIDCYEYQGKSKKALEIEDVARSVREMWMLSPDQLQTWWNYWKRMVALSFSVTLELISSTQ